MLPLSPRTELILIHSPFDFVLAHTKLRVPFFMLTLQKEKRTLLAKRLDLDACKAKVKKAQSPEKIQQVSSTRSACKFILEVVGFFVYMYLTVNISLVFPVNHHYAMMILTNLFSSSITKRATIIAVHNVLSSCLNRSHSNAWLKVSFFLMIKQKRWHVYSFFWSRYSCTWSLSITPLLWSNMYTASVSIFLQSEL